MSSGQLRGVHYVAALTINIVICVVDIYHTYSGFIRIWWVYYVTRQGKNNSKEPDKSKIQGATLLHYICKFYVNFLSPGESINKSNIYILVSMETKNPEGLYTKAECF